MKILIAGEGGQGVQLIAELLAKGAFDEGKESLYIPNFGVEQRGGISLAYVIIDSQPIPYPKFAKAEILAILCDRAIERVINFVDNKTKIILGPAVSKRKIKDSLEKNLVILKPAWFPPKVWNILVLGKINSLGKVLSIDSLKKVMEEKLKSKFEADPGLEEINQRALYFNK